jgi:hypothetical protein
MRSLVKSAQTQNTPSLGRLTEANELSIAPSLQNYPPIQIVLQRCVDCLSVLMQARFNSQEQVRVGLCPDRKKHDHSRSAITFSWGCSRKWLRQWRQY